MNEPIEEGDLIVYNKKGGYGHRDIEIFALVIERHVDQIAIYVSKSNYFTIGTIQRVFISKDNWILALPDEPSPLCSRASQSCDTVDRF